MLFSSVILFFSLLQIATTITPGSLFQLDDPRITGYRNVSKLPLKLNILEHLLLHLFGLKEKQSKLFAALQQFKRFVCFVLKVQMTTFIDMIVWIGILIVRLYQKNYNPMIPDNMSKILMLRTALN